MNVVYRLQHLFKVETRYFWTVPSGNYPVENVSTSNKFEGHVCYSLLLSVRSSILDRILAKPQKSDYVRVIKLAVNVDFSF